MTQPERDRLVARIIAGVVPLRVYWGGSFRYFLIRRPSRLELFEVEQTYERALQEAEMEGLLKDDELERYLWQEGFWDEPRERALLEFQQNIEKLKIGMYQNRHDRDVLSASRRKLEITHEKIAELLMQKHAHDSLSCAGYARLCKTRHRLAISLHEGDSRVFPALSYLADDSTLLDRCIAAWNETQLDDRTIRDCARNVPWRAIWQSRESSRSLFGLDTVDYTEEQHQLVAASNLYEQVRNHPECPSDFVLNDDDLLDGWLILEHKKQAQAEDEKDIESTIHSTKIKNSQEVFKVVGKNKELAKKVNAMNSDGARKTIEKRFQAIEEKGAMSIQNLPDMQQRIRMEQNNMQ